jgi:hypothetical protein
MSSGQRAALAGLWGAALILAFGGGSPTAAAPAADTFANNSHPTTSNTSQQPCAGTAAQQHNTEVTMGKVVPLCAPAPPAATTPTRVATPLQGNVETSPTSRVTTMGQGQMPTGLAAALNGEVWQILNVPRDYPQATAQNAPQPTRQVPQRAAPEMIAPVIPASTTIPPAQLMPRTGAQMASPTPASSNPIQAGAQSTRLTGGAAVSHAVAPLVGSVDYKGTVIMINIPGTTQGYAPDFTGPPANVGQASQPYAMVSGYFASNNDFVFRWLAKKSTPNVHEPVSNLSTTLRPLY